MIEEYRPQYDSKGHWRNKGRESLWELNPNDLYIINAEFVEEKPCKNPNNTRLVFQNVIVYNYTTDTRLEELPAIAHAEHLSSIRKKEGLEHARLEPGKRGLFIGKLEEYQSYKAEGVERRSFKIFRDVNIAKELRVIEKRLSNIRSQWVFISPKERLDRTNKTLSLFDRLEKIHADYIYIPYLTSDELGQRIEQAKKDTLSLLKKCGKSTTTSFRITKQR